MKLNFNSIMIGSHQPKVLVKFYEGVFGKKPDMGEGDWGGWQVGESFFNIGGHSEVKGKAKEPQRIILNLETDKVQEEFDRIKEVDGVKVIKEPYEMSMGGESEGSMMIATLADPDGNYFQLMSPWDASDLN